MTATGDAPQRAQMRRTRTGQRVTVKPRKANPGRKLFRAVTKKAGASSVENLSDLELLTLLLGKRAAEAVTARLEPHGGLKGFHTLGEAGPHGLLMPGVDEANAARLLVLWEVSARISEPFRGES